MKQKLKTTLAFTKNFLTTGAFKETSKEVENEICTKLSDKEDIIVVEFGMGHGNITKEILKAISANSKLYAFEVKQEFCDHVKETIVDDRLIIVNDGAENVKNYVKENVNNVIASIPFSFFSKEKGMQIIQDSYDILNENCFYSQVLYTKFNFKKFETIFEDCTIIKIPNIPTEYIYHCKKQTKNL